MQRVGFKTKTHSKRRENYRPNASCELIYSAKQASLLAYNTDLCRLYAACRVCVHLPRCVKGFLYVSPSSPWDSGEKWHIPLQHPVSARGHSWESWPPQTHFDPQDVFTETEASGGDVMQCLCTVTHEQLVSIISYTSVEESGAGGVNHKVLCWGGGTRCEQGVRQKKYVQEKFVEKDCQSSV